MKASAAASGDSEEWHGTEMEALPIRLSPESELSVLDNTPGVSLAASVDPDGNRQLFDLSSNGIVRLVRIFCSLVGVFAMYLALNYARGFFVLENMPCGSTIFWERTC